LEAQMDTPLSSSCPSYLPSFHHCNAPPQQEIALHHFLHSPSVDKKEHFRLVDELFVEQSEPRNTDDPDKLETDTDIVGLDSDILARSNATPLFDGQDIRDYSTSMSPVNSEAIIGPFAGLSFDESVSSPNPPLEEAVPSMRERSISNPDSHPPEDAESSQKKSIKKQIQTRLSFKKETVRVQQPQLSFAIQPVPVPRVTLSQHFVKQILQRKSQSPKLPPSEQHPIPLNTAHHPSPPLILPERAQLSLQLHNFSVSLEALQLSPRQQSALSLCPQRTLPPPVSKKKQKNKQAQKKQLFVHWSSDLVVSEHPCASSLEDNMLDHQLSSIWDSDEQLTASIYNVATRKGFHRRSKSCNSGITVEDLGVDLDSEDNGTHHVHALLHNTVMNALKPSIFLSPSKKEKEKRINELKKTEVDDLKRLEKAVILAKRKKLLQATKIQQQKIQIDSEHSSIQTSLLDISITAREFLDLYYVCVSKGL